MNRQCPAGLLAIFLLAASAQTLTAAENVDILRSPATQAAIARAFSADEERLLDAVQRGCFDYFWREVLPPAYVARDRFKAPVSSVAAVGFQLSALPIGVERGWITRAEGEARALAVLDALLGRADNRRFGVYLHYVDRQTAGLSATSYEVLASTIDSALLIAGAIPAGEYFGGEVRARVDRMVAEANWRAFVVEPERVICMGWEPEDRTRMDGPGRFHQGRWTISSAEEHVIYWLAVGAPVAEHAVAPELYFRLRREVGRHENQPPFVMSWNGSLFHYFFDHCWIDYRGLEADDPGAFGVKAPRVDWFENSRRAVLTHRARCIAARERFATFDEHIWGLSACASRDGYIVPGLQPSIWGEDDWGAGTVAPYAAASAIMFAPEESIAAIRAMRALLDQAGKPFAWRDPAEGGYGFVDSFNRTQNYASDDYVGIDQGPMLLAIENARTGLIWKLFMRYPANEAARRRLRLEWRDGAPPAAQPGDASSPSSDR